MVPTASLPAEIKLHGLGCTEAGNLQKIPQIPIPQKPLLAPKEQLLALLFIAPSSGMRVSVPLSCSTVICMVLTSVCSFPR